MVSNWVSSLGIQLKTDTWVELVMGWGGDANVVHVFGERQYGVVAIGVFFTEGLMSMGHRLPIGGAILITKCFASRYEEIMADDEGFRTDDVGVVFGLVEGASCIIFIGIKFCVGEADP